MDYNVARDRLREIKEQIDKEIKEGNGISESLIKHEKPLQNAYKTAMRLRRGKQDERFLNFNYYSCNCCISLAKNKHYVALMEWLKGFKNFIEYTNQLKDTRNWENSLNYHHSRLNLIRQRRIEIFRNLPPDRFNEIITAFEEGIAAVNNNKLAIKIQEILINALDFLVSNSTEIYTEEHLRRKNVLIGLLKKFPNKDNYILGMKSRIEFMLLKKELHYCLRKEYKEKKFNQSDIERIISQMTETAGREKNSFKKVGYDEKMARYQFLSKIDCLVTEYYNTLWVHSDFIEAVKCLEQIFSEIRNNLNIIPSASIFRYFVNEFLFLQNYIKLLLVANDFKDFSHQDIAYEWQKELSKEIFDEIVSIAQDQFKYTMAQDIKRSLLIVEESSAGKFLEFIIFYLLKELLDRRDQSLLKLTEINAPEIRNFIQSILNSKPEEIRWSHKISNNEIDISISNKYAIFIKTGIIGSSDKKKIQKELAIPNNYNIFYLLDIAKNLDVVKKMIRNQDNRIILIDVGKFLNEIYEFAKKVGVEIELSKSSIKSLTGFYSEG